MTHVLEIESAEIWQSSIQRLCKVLKWSSQTTLLLDANVLVIFFRKELKPSGAEYRRGDAVRCSASRQLTAPTSATSDVQGWLNLRNRYA